MIVGLDISKETIDISILDQETSKSLQVSNNLLGFKKLSKYLNDESNVSMEARGAYYLNVAQYLYERSYKVSVINPLVIKRYCQMKMIRAKTDKADGQLIAEYTLDQSPDLWEPNAPEIDKLKRLNSVLNKLIEQQTAWKNKQEAFEVDSSLDTRTKKLMKKMLRQFEKNIATLELEISKLIEVYYSEESGILKSVPGIGNKTASALLCITNGFRKFENSKQLVSYVGLAPRIYESGTSERGKSRICKLGTKRIRQLLYMCTWTAIKVNQGCRNLYERLIEAGKPTKVALIAVANKLLRQAFALVKKNEFYNQNLSI